MMNVCGVNTIARDKNGWTPIHYAAYSNQKAVIQCLARDLLGPGRPGIDLMHLLSHSQWMSTIELIQNKNARASFVAPLRSKNKDTSSRLKMITFLTPLTLAVQRLSLEAVQTLIFHRADPTLMDSTGVCPYDRALLMADELSGRLEALDLKVQNLQHLLVRGTLRTSIIHLLHRCWYHCRGYCRSGVHTTLDHHRRRGDHYKMLNTSLFEATGKCEPLKF